MGVSDFQSMIGNRDGSQAGYNFDLCESRYRKNREGKLPVCIVPKTLKYRKFKDMFEEEGSTDFGMCELVDDELVGDIIIYEGAILTLEVFRTSTQTEYAGGCNREFERKFMKEVYPYVVEKKLEYARAIADDWELVLENYDNIEYFNAAGIFKLGKHLANYNDEYLDPGEIFDDFDPETEEVWVRSWYTQAYKGLVERELSQISDECLVHVAFELGAKNPHKVKVGRLWKWCCDTIERRYF